jgi:hypothetical protein
MYTRSDRFQECVKRLLRQCATHDDNASLPVLLDDAELLSAAFQADPALLIHPTDLTCAFTLLIGATLLHITAEYGNTNASRTLIQAGADVNSRAATDAFGMNGYTPIFHTVNSNANRNEPTMRMLLDAGAAVDIHLEGIVWGKGFEWETTYIDVTPISNPQMGLLPQVHRDEAQIYHNITLMLERSGRTAPPLPNIPNRYLKP